MKQLLLTLTILVVFSSLSAQTGNNPFAKLGYKKHIMYTSSKGEFEEFHDMKDVVEIGSVLFNTKINKIVGFIDEQQEKAEVASATAAMSIDPLCEQYYWITPYAFCLNNPIRFIDPDGRSTRVAQNEDGTYRVIGGDLKDKDRNIYVYTQDKKGNYTVKGETIGITSSITSFYNADANGGRGEWVIGSVINPQDQSGDNFLNDIFGNTPTMLDDYIANAGNGEKYDFKTTNGTDTSIEGIDQYRGMPIGITGNGQPIYSSARDIGNMAAGYIAGANGMSWFVSRIAFDAYQSKVSGKPAIESISTRNAQYYGWQIGSNIVNNTPTQKANNLLKSIWKWIAK